MGNTEICWSRSKCQNARLFVVSCSGLSRVFLSYSGMFRVFCSISRPEVHASFADTYSRMILVLVTYSQFCRVFLCHDPECLVFSCHTPGWLAFFVSVSVLFAFFCAMLHAVFLFFWGIIQIMSRFFYVMPPNVSWCVLLLRSPPISEPALSRPGTSTRPTEWDMTCCEKNRGHWLLDHHVKLVHAR